MLLEEYGFLREQIKQLTMVLKELSIDRAIQGAARDPAERAWHRVDCSDGDFAGAPGYRALPPGRSACSVRRIDSVTVLEC